MYADIHVTLKDLYLGHQFKARPPNIRPSQGDFTKPTYAWAAEPCGSFARGMHTTTLVHHAGIDTITVINQPSSMDWACCWVWGVICLLLEARKGGGLTAGGHWNWQVTRDKPVAKLAPGVRKCNCRNKVVTRQLGPGMFQQFQQQECQVRQPPHLSLF